jgi:peptide/nickel transport system ATP-binding protein
MPPLFPGDSPGHEFRCFFPVGTPEGKAALERNLEAGQTAAGTPVAISRREVTV